MKIGLITGTAASINLLQFLKSNTIETFVFPGFTDQSSGDLLSINEFCNSVGIQINSSKNIYDWMILNNLDIIFIFGFTELIDLTLVPDYLRPNLFNIHFGGLPEFKGPTPLFWQIKKGGQNVSMAIHLINNKFDDGPLIWQKEILNEDHFTYGFLDLLFSQLVIEGVTHIVNCILKDGIVPEILTENKISKYYKRPELTDVLIQWSKYNSVEIINLVKACNPWNKGAVTLYQGREVKIVDAEISTEKNKVYYSQPGSIIDNNLCLKVLCRDKKVIQINMLTFNNLFLPGRQADKLGFIVGGVFDNGGII